MTGRFAAETSVSVEKSRAEIERTLDRYGATSFMYGWDPGRAAIGFVVRGRQIRFLLPMPDKNEREFTHTPERGTPRSESQAYAAWEQACRQRWRALALVIKAKLEAVETGIVSFETEFAMFMVLPSGRTVGEELLPNLDRALDTGEVPEFLPALEARHG